MPRTMLLKIDELLKNPQKLTEFQEECDAESKTVFEAIAEALTELMGWKRKHCSRSQKKALVKANEVQQAIGKLKHLRTLRQNEEHDFREVFARMIQDRFGVTPIEFEAAKLLDLTEQKDDRRTQIKALDSMNERRGVFPHREKPEEHKTPMVAIQIVNYKKDDDEPAEINIEVEE